ncbi:MAG: hypothetical protein KM312_12240 [Hydrogenibacillus schlegelii]|uniref:Tetratricopeptide repeat protein n=1 Tax=Hydrogenibacillus schlegelii TaxID=1484 RepID=A0A947CZ31_HYDSH|nr:hypothetical protein [Hydrogenibacillus schlegelii]
MWDRFIKLNIILLGALLLVSVVNVTALATSPKTLNLSQTHLDQAASPPKVDTLSPRDRFIAETFFSHRSAQPDENESLEVLQGYVKGMDMLQRGNDVDAVVDHFETLTRSFPDARHAWEGLGIALKERYSRLGNKEDLRQATHAFIKAIDIGLRFGRVPVNTVYPAAIGLGTLGDTERLNTLFSRIVAKEPTNHLIALDYARGLAAAGSRDAETWFRKALQLRPTGAYDAVIEYGQWLLDHGRYEDALQVLTLRPGEPTRYVHFLRGYAWERLGRADEAKQEYAAYRRLTAERPGIDRWAPIPDRYRISGSALQEGILFAGDVSPQDHCTAHNNLAKMIECEASGESMGGKQAVGWVARNRATLGSRGCVYVNNSGSSICDKYQSVLTQSGQFVLSCPRSPSASSIDAAYYVWYGYAPETSTGWCPGTGTYVSNACTQYCGVSNQDKGLSVGDWMFYSTSGTCPSSHPGAYCTLSDDKLCKNGGSDHCFYWVPSS